MGKTLVRDLLHRPHVVDGDGEHFVEPRFVADGLFSGGEAMNGSVVRSALRTPSTVSTVSGASLASNGTSTIAKAMLRSSRGECTELVT